MLAVFKVAEGEGGIEIRETEPRDPGPGEVRLKVSAAQDGRWLRIAVEDDGPGIAAEHREAVLARGRRLDEAVAGAGLGLGIVCDIAEIYRGRLSLEESALGGLKAVLELPVAE